MREGNRSRGVGLVEFGTRENLIEALKRTDKEIYGRRIRVNVSDKTDLHQNDSNRSNFGNRYNRMGGRADGEERPEMADRWKRVERRSDEFSEDRPRNDFQRDRPQRNEHGRCKNYSSLSKHQTILRFLSFQRISPVIHAMVNVVEIMDLVIHVREMNEDMIDKDHVTVIITMMIIDRINRDTLVEPVIHVNEKRLLVFSL